MKDILDILKEIRPEFSFEDSSNFIDDGYLDSFDLVALVSAIEEKYSIVIDALDVVPEYFKDLDAISNLIKKNGGEV